MKKFTLILMLIFIGKIGFSQITYFNYLDHTSEWRSYNAGWTGLNNYTIYKTTYFDGDTIVNGQAYYKQYAKSVETQINPPTGPTYTVSHFLGPFFYREDASGKFYKINSTTGIEETVFDNQDVLNAQVGLPFPEIGGTCNVSAVQMINFGSATLKKITGTNIGNITGSLEGVGVIGLSCSILIEGGENLHCYTKQGVSLQFGLISCDSFPVPDRSDNLSLNSLSVVDETIIVYPNPTNGIISVHSINSEMNKSYKLYDVNGILIESGVLIKDVQEISMINYSKGVYILKINGENSFNIKRVVKN